MRVNMKPTFCVIICLAYICKILKLSKVFIQNNYLLCELIYANEYGNICMYVHAYVCMCNELGVGQRSGSHKQ